MQTDNTAGLTQRTPSKCHYCKDVVRFLRVVLNALNQLTVSLQSHFLPYSTSTSTVFSYMTCSPFFPRWAFSQECFFSITYLSHSFNLLQSFPLDNYEDSYPDQSSDFSKSHSKQQNKALNQFEFIQILCSLLYVFFVSYVSDILWENIYLKKKIVPKIQYSTLFAAFSIPCLFPFIEN